MRQIGTLVTMGITGIQLRVDTKCGKSREGKLLQRHCEGS